LRIILENGIIRVGIVTKEELTMKNKSIIIILGLAIVIMILICCALMVKYLQTRELYINEHEITANNARYTYYREIQNQKEIEKLRQELSKYDSSYKNIIDIDFYAELEEITEENTRLKVKSTSSNVDGDYELIITEETEIVKNGDIMDKSVLEIGQNLHIWFESEELEEYSNILTNIKSIEIK